MADKPEEKKAQKLKPTEVEAKVVELAKSGTPPEKIGLILRDQFGVAKVRAFGKKISQILKENDLYVDSEHANIAKKVDTLKGHFENNKHDYSAKRSLMTYTAQLHKLNRKVAA